MLDITLKFKFVAHLAVMFGEGPFPFQHIEIIDELF